MHRKKQWVYVRRFGNTAFILAKITQKKPRDDYVQSPYYPSYGSDRGALLFTFLVITLYLFLKHQHLIS